MPYGVFGSWVAIILALTVLQTFGHPGVVLGADRVAALVDLDGSNGLPDLVSRAATVVTAVGSILAGEAETGRVGRRDVSAP